MRTTIKNNQIRMISMSAFLAGFFLISICFSCSKSDDGGSFSINAKAQTFTLNGTNNCNTSIGTGSTFIFDIPYSASDGTTISKLHIKTTVSNGESDQKINTKFTDESNTISWATCFRYGSQDWVEFEVRLESEEGEQSNWTKTRVNKPEGAQ